MCQDLARTFARCLLFTFFCHVSASTMSIPTRLSTPVTYVSDGLPLLIRAALPLDLLVRKPAFVMDKSSDPNAG